MGFDAINLFLDIEKSLLLAGDRLGAEIVAEKRRHFVKHKKLEFNHEKSSIDYGHGYVMPKEVK
jgi:hypothetical protein